MHVAATPHAVRVGGVWISRAQAGLARGKVVDAGPTLTREPARRRPGERVQAAVLARAAQPSEARAA